MKKPSITIFAALALTAAPHLSAQQILPDHFASWTSLSRPTLVLWPRSPEAAKDDSHPESAQLLQESGVVRVEERYYQKGDAEVSIRVFKLRDPSSAYEVYTSQLRSQMMPTDVGQVSSFDKQGVLIQVGSLVIEASANISKGDLRALVQAVEANSGEAPLPPIRTYLPGRGRALGTERYALGPVALGLALAGPKGTEFDQLAGEVGFARGAEAMLAQYEMGKDTAVLLLIEYPTPQLAEQHLHHLQTALPAAAQQLGTTVERKGSLLSLVLAPTSGAYAENLRSAINYETEVTWHQPKQTITDPPWSTVLGKIITFTMLFMVVAIVLGVAFGGVRVLAKVFLPGKVFDRPQQMDVLQLGLSSKRIDSKDFY